MPATQQIAEVVDFQDYRRRRARAEPALHAAAVAMPITFGFFWMPMIVFVPVWRLG